MPADILPSAVNLPVAIVYDADGAVTDALLGQGAGEREFLLQQRGLRWSGQLQRGRASAARAGRPERVCAQTSQQLPDLGYRLVRVLGRVLGLDWSQMNVNVFTRNPAPSQADYAGLTIMHAQDPINCVPISICYRQRGPAENGRPGRALRLYPVTAENQASFPGKELFFENTVRIHGSGAFCGRQRTTGATHARRECDCPLDRPRYRSAFAHLRCRFCFRVSCFTEMRAIPPPDSTTAQDKLSIALVPMIQPMEGFFDLAGLEIPNGASSAQYQLSVEPLDPLWSQIVGPYGPWQVRPPARSNH